MTTQSILNAYRRYAGIYDSVFGAIFAEGRRLAIRRAVNAPGLRVLEVAVGTGLSLPDYPADCEVWGIDISAPMLEKAGRRVDALGLSQVKGLDLMDAEAMTFADNSFDAVMVMYAASVVGNPHRMFREISRICKPGATIMVVNHLSASHWLLRRLEKAITPLSNLIGFRPDYSLGELLDDSRMEMVSIESVNLFGYWKLVQFRNVAAPAQTAPQVEAECAIAPAPLLEPEGA